MDAEISVKESLLFLLWDSDRPRIKTSGGVIKNHSETKASFLSIYQYIFTITCVNLSVKLGNLEDGGFFCI